MDSHVLTQEVTVQDTIAALIETGQNEIQKRAAHQNHDLDALRQKQAAEQAEKWQPFLDGLRQRLPAWTHDYLTGGVGGPTNQAVYDKIRLWPAVLNLPDCAPIYLYALHTREGWRFRIEAARYDLHFDEDDDESWQVLDQAERDRPLSDLLQELDTTDLAVAVAEAHDAIATRARLQTEADERNRESAGSDPSPSLDDLQRAQLSANSGLYVQAGLFVAIALVKELRAGRHVLTPPCCSGRAQEVMERNRERTDSG